MPPGVAQESGCVRKRGRRPLYSWRSPAPAS